MAVKRLRGPLPGRIVYVSCHPATPACDSRHLVQVPDHRPAAAGALVMFPQTSHVEPMAPFARP